jgi:L-ribulose-5-phosphate 3-epimerase
MRLTNQLAANSGSYHSNRIEDALKGIAKAGFRFVELTAIRGVVEHVPLNASAGRLGDIENMLAAEGLTAISLSGHSDLTTPDGLKDGLLALDLCERLGTRIMNTAVGGPFNDQEDEEAFLRGIHPFADQAAKRGVRIGIEIHGSLTGDGQKTRELIEKVDHPHVGINYDTANCEYFSGVKVEEDLCHALPYVIHCHLKDTVGGYRIWNFPAIGKGRIDFRNVLGQFEAARYAGPFSVELEFQGEPYPPPEIINEAMRQSYEFLNKLGLDTNDLSDRASVRT